MKFKVDKQPYEEEIDFFKNDEIEFQPNTISCLVGCNGSGKTTILSTVINELRHKEYFELKNKSPYDGLFGAFTHNEPTLVDSPVIYMQFSKHTEKIANSESSLFLNAGLLAYSSTGEAIIQRYSDSLKTLFPKLPEMKNKTLILTIDDADAGTSIDMIKDIKMTLGLIEERCKKYNITYYIITTANSYEFSRDYDCINVHDFSHLRVKDYEDFKQFVLSSRKIKDIREEQEEQIRKASKED